jgi:hypothetical protein
LIAGFLPGCFGLKAEVGESKSREVVFVDAAENAAGRLTAHL